MKTIQYSSNNSGGKWWLKDADWAALERAGWEVKWGGVWFCNSDYNQFLNAKKPAYRFKKCKVTKKNGQDWNECKGHRQVRSYEEAKKIQAKDRWLDAIATCASIKTNSIAEAIRSWEKATGMDASAEGCGCCGPPHSFSGDGEYASGRECAEVLVGVRGLSYRELLEKVKEGR